MSRGGSPESRASPDQPFTAGFACAKVTRYADIGEGATYQSTWLDIAPWTGTVSL